VWSELLDETVTNKHSTIFASFALLFVDIPFILLAPLTLWRFPQVLYYMILIQIEQSRQEKVWKELRTSTAPEQRAALVKSDIVTLGAPTRWMLVASTLVKTIKDVPVTFFVLLMTCTVWRMFALVPRLHRRKLALNEQKRQKEQAKKPTETTEQKQQRSPNQAIEEVQLQMIPPKSEDLELQIVRKDPAALDEEKQQLSVVVEPSHHQQRQHLVTYDTKHSLHLVILKEFIHWCVDIPFVFCALWLLVLGWWRIPSLLRKLQKPCFEYREPKGPIQEKLNSEMEQLFSRSSVYERSSHEIC